MNLNNLYKLAASGDGQVQKQLFDHLFVSFRLFVRQKVSDSEEAEEVIQAAMTKIADKYREIEITSSFAAWAHKVLKNEILTYYRSRSSRRKRFESLADAEETKPASSTDPTLKAQLLECIRKMNQPYPRHVRILNLHYQGFGTEEICRKMEVSQTNFYVILSRARTMLRNCLTTGDIER